MRFLVIGLFWLATALQAATPNLQSVSPADNATGVSTVPTFIYTFNVAVTTDSKKISIYDSGNNEIGHLYADNSSGTLTGTVSGSGTNTITVAFELTGGSGNDVPLNTGTAYYVQIEPNAFINNGDKSSQLRNDFTTTNIAFSGPTLSSSSPADNATGVALASNIVLNFSEAVDAESGNITIKKTSDNSTVETISVTSGQVTGSGTNQITINPSVNLDRGVEYYVLIDATAFDDSDSNSYAGISSTTALSFTTSSSPALLSVSPADGATEVSMTPTFTYTFDVAVTADSKKISIYDSSDNEVGYLNADNSGGTLTGTVSGSGTDTITVAFALSGGSGNDVPLNSSTAYYIQFEANAFSGGGNKTSSIRNDFTTVTVPTLSSSSPADNATGVALASNIVLNFSEAVDAESGNITIKKTSDNSTVETISVTSGQVTGSGTSQITINPSANFAIGTEYYVLVDATAFDDSDSNSYAGISSTTALSFTASAGPALISVSPADGATGVSTTPTFTYTFSSSVTVNSQKIYIYDSSHNEIGYLFADGSGGGSLTGTVSGSGTDTITVAFALSGGSGNDVPLNTGTAYYVQIASGAFSSGGNTTSQISNNFTTISAPTLSSSSPADNATGVALASNIVLNFSEAVDAESGNITIKKTSDNSTVETISVTSGQVTGSGTSQITINPSADLSSKTEYYVLIDATAFDDIDSESYAGISSSTELNFTSVDVEPPVMTTSPTSGATNVHHNVHVEFIFDENIRLLDNTALNDQAGSNNINALITLRKDDINGEDIAFNAIIDYENDGTVKLEAFLESNLDSLQTVYAAIQATALEDESDNAITSDVAFTFVTGSFPYYDNSHPVTLQKNIGIDADIVLEFDRVVYAESSGVNRAVEIYNADTSSKIYTFQSDSEYITGSGTKRIAINPPANLEEHTNYYVLIGTRAFKDGDDFYFPGISDDDSLAFKTAKDPRKYADVIASNEKHADHSVNQVEKSIAAINNRQNYIRRNNGRNKSHQGIAFKFNHAQLDNAVNKLSPLINHFNQYSLSDKLSNAVDKVLPNDWGLWTSGEISIGNTNSKNGSDSDSRSRELTIGLDKQISDKQIAGVSYRVNKTKINVGNLGTKMDSNTKSWSLYGSLKNGNNSELEALIGRGDISTNHTRVDGNDTYTGTRKSEQIFLCLIARENYQVKEMNLSPFVRIDTSHTKQGAYSESGNSATAYNALHYKENKFHNSIISFGIDAHNQFEVGNKTIKPYLSLRHKENTGYELNSTMYYTSNPVKEYTQNISSDDSNKGFNLVVGADIKSDNDWLVNLNYELSESQLTFSKGVRFRVEWKF